MPYNTKTLITDASRIMPVPQYFNPNTDSYEAILGAYGASRVMLWDASGNALLTSGNPGVVKISDGSNQLTVNANGSISTVSLGSNAQLYDGTAIWANSDPVNTAKDLDVPLPALLQSQALYEITITDPSADSDLTVIIKNKETFGGTARFPELKRFGVPKSSPEGKSVLVQGWLLGEGGRLTISNDTVIGATGTFTAYVRVRKV